MIFKYKEIINTKGKVFLRRLSFYLKEGSIKIHFITDDDTDEPHTHPWNYKSLLIIPYREKLFMRTGVFVKNHKPFKTVKRKMKMKHRVELYRILGIKIPALTIGVYSEKKQLCSLCEEAGYCKQKAKLVL